MAFSYTYTYSDSYGYIGLYPDGYGGSESITRIDNFITAGTATFESPGMFNYPYGGFDFTGWTPTFVNSTYCYATSAGDNTIAWDYAFATVGAIRLDLNYYDSTGFVVHEIMEFSNTGYGNFVKDTWDTHQYVPLPPSAILLGSGLLGLVGLRGLRWRKGKATA